jgi:hypothetical protein
VDDEHDWMFHALGSAFATRAWLYRIYNEVARDDARTALHGIQRDPNPEAITEAEVNGALERFDGWRDRATDKRGTMTALHVISYALRVLVMVQQFAKAGDPAAKTVQSQEFTTRLTFGVQELRRRIENW